MSQLKQIKATPELIKFFENLIEIKRFVKNAQEVNSSPILQEIYERLEKVIKTEKQ